LRFEDTTMLKIYLCLFVCGLVLCTKDAFAEPHAVRLQYVRGQGAESCPDEAFVRDAIGRSMRYDPFTAKATERLIVTMYGDGAHVQGKAELRNAAGASQWTETAEPHECEVVIRSLSMAIGLRLDPWFAAANATSRPDAAAPSAGTPISAATPKRQAGDRADRRAGTSDPDARSVRIGAGLGGAAALGGAPSGIAGILNASFVVRGRYWSGTLEAQGQPPAGTESQGARLVSARVGGALIPCGHFSVLYACGVVQLGAWFGKIDAVVPDSRTVLYAAAGARFGVEVDATSWLKFAVFGDVLGALRRPLLLLDDGRQWEHAAVHGVTGAQTIALF
jgi:hypothetical protein